MIVGPSMLGPVLITVDKKSEKRFESVVESDKGGGVLHWFLTYLELLKCLL